MSKTDFQDLPRFVRYAQKMFHLNLLAGAFTDSRPCPEIPGRAISLSLLLGEVAQIPSLLQLEAETQLPQWQQWVGYKHPISDDALAYVERADGSAQTAAGRHLDQSQAQARKSARGEQNQRTAGRERGCQRAILQAIIEIARTV